MITVTASTIFNAMCQRASNLPMASPLKAVSTENPLRKPSTAHTLHGKMPDHVRCCCCSQKLCCVPQSRSASVQSVRTRISMLLPAAPLQLFDSLLIMCASYFMYLLFNWTVLCSSLFKACRHLRQCGTRNHNLHLRKNWSE
jgi:hypothetical protein